MKRKRFNKENVPPPAKKKLKLSLKDRFKTPMSEKQLEVAAQGVTPTNTKLANDWAVKNFTIWINLQLNLKIRFQLTCYPARMLVLWLCCYVQETKKESGQRYPATTLCSLLGGIQRPNKVRLISLTSLTYVSGIYI